MSWRKNMGVESENEHFTPYAQKPQKPQKVRKKIKNNSFEAFESIEAKSQKVKTLQEKIDILWNHATKLADWIDDENSNIPWQDRAARVPELQKMSLEIDRLKAKQHVAAVDIKNPQ